MVVLSSVLTAFLGPSMSLCSYWYELTMLTFPTTNRLFPRRLDGWRHPPAARPFLSLSLRLPLPRHPSLLFTSPHHPLIRRGLCVPFTLSHSEGWLQWIVGNRIQLCCGRPVCVSACAGIRPVLCQFDGSVALLSPVRRASEASAADSRGLREFGNSWERRWEELF